MAHDMEVGLSPGDFVFHGTELSAGKGTSTRTQFLVHVYCGQTAGRMKTPLYGSRPRTTGSQLSAKGAQHNNPRLSQLLLSSCTYYDRPME